MRVAMVSFDAGEYGVQVANAICDQADVLLLSPRDRVEPYASKLNPKVESYFFDMPRIDISSRLVRRRIAAGEPVRYLVPDAVAGYIQREGLYT